ncbi:MAG: helix-turn-helix domain-containing protein [bacterium]|nr:helix-turn-helix domain-containing protein [bacterium]
MNSLLNLLDISNKEYVVYKSLLKQGPVSIRELAADTKINRGTTHEILRELVKKGLVCYQMGGARKRYLAESPQKLINLAKEKEIEIKQLISSLGTKVIPELEASKITGSSPTVKYYEGEEGIEKVLLDILQSVENTKDKTYYAYSALPIRKYLYQQFPNFTKQRINKGIKVNVIALGKGGEEVQLAQRKWIQNSSSSSSSYIIIYADKYAIISITEDELPYAVIIEESGLVQTQKIIFQSLWSLLP